MYKYLILQMEVLLGGAFFFPKMKLSLQSIFFCWASPRLLPVGTSGMAQHGDIFCVCGLGCTQCMFCPDLQPVTVSDLGGRDVKMPGPPRAWTPGPPRKPAALLAFHPNTFIQRPTPCCPGHHRRPSRRPSPSHAGTSVARHHLQRGQACTTEYSRTF